MERREDRNEAPGRSILFKNKRRDLTLYLYLIHIYALFREIFKSENAHLSNCLHTPWVWDSTPSTASIKTTAPSTTRLALSTSMPKSACPGVSIKLNVQSLHETGILADWMVMPRSRSAGRKSVVVLPVSTVPGHERYPDVDKMDSVKVVFPESIDVFK